MLTGDHIGSPLQGLQDALGHIVGADTIRPPSYHRTPCHDGRLITINYQLSTINCQLSTTANLTSFLFSSHTP